MKFDNYTSRCGKISIKTSLHDGDLHVMARCLITTLDFHQQLKCAENAVREAAENISAEYAPVSVRYFLSDIANQAEHITNIWECALSVVGQAPADGTKVSIWAHFSLNAHTTQVADNLWETKYAGHIYYRYANHLRTSDTSYSLTREMMEEYAQLLSAHGCRLEDNCVRTWFFVRDIDTNYHGLVKARNEVFEKHSLVASTHYIASTGIGGTSLHTAIRN